MKILAVATLAVGLLACCIALPHVVKFDVQETEVLRKGRLQSFKFTNCLPTSKEMLVVNSLSLMPDPLVFPGPLTVSFDATVGKDVAAPLKAVVYLGKKVGDIFIKIPCIGSIGSCTYDDVCALLEQINECPQPFVAAGLTCHCPFKTGSYKVPQANFNVETALFPPGDYHGQANLTMNGAVVGCYDIMATFSN